MKDSKLYNHLEELGEDMKQKRIVIERFMSEMHTKNEQIETYKKKYQEQVQVIQQYEVRIIFSYLCQHNNQCRKMSMN